MQNSWRSCYVPGCPDAPCSRWLEIYSTRLAETRLLELKKLSNAHEYNSDRLMLTGELFVLELLLQEAAEERYLYPTKGLEFSNLEQLTRYADFIIEQANLWSLPS